MAEITPKRSDRLDPEQYLGLVRSALHPDERKFFKEYLGQESPDVMDYLFPQERFANARQIREGIVRSVLSEAIKPRATYGEAGELFPGFPGTGGSAQPGVNMSTTPMTPDPAMRPDRQSPTAQEQMGREIVDNTRSNIGYWQNVNQMPQAIDPILPGARPPGFTGRYEGLTPENDMSEWGRTDYSPRNFDSSSIVPNAQGMVAQGPAMTPPTPGVNNDALLPRVHQELLNQRIHREGLRLWNPSTMMKPDLFNRYRALKSGLEPEAWEGEAEAIGSILGANPKIYGDDTNVGRRQRADADIAEGKAPFAGPQARANLERTQAQTEDIRSNTLTENTLRGARLDKLLAQVELAQKQADLAGDQSASERHKQNLIKFNLLKLGLARGEFNEEEEVAIINSILKGTDLEVTPEQPGAIRQFFGLPGKGIKVQPKGGTSQPLSDRKAKAKALYDSLKEGETGELDGKMFKRQGGKLIEAQ